MHGYNHEDGLVTFGKATAFYNTLLRERQNRRGERNVSSYSITFRKRECTWVSNSKLYFSVSLVGWYIVNFRTCQLMANWQYTEKYFTHSNYFRLPFPLTVTPDTFTYTPPPQPSRSSPPASSSTSSIHSFIQYFVWRQVQSLLQNDAST